ncbi:hypothetical protein [Paraburkholderia sp. BR10954]|uniref:hypothetical protein n=1 Tax=Paraburkholderia sp. BR10954 TaxID=3236995 RepID=UPI0034D2669C
MSTAAKLAIDPYVLEESQDDRLMLAYPKVELLVALKPEIPETCVCERLTKKISSI